MTPTKKRMAHPLYLTVAEQKLFDKLPANLKEGWEVKEEKGRYEDTDKKRMLRMTFLTLADPKLKEFQKKARGVQSEAELVSLAKSLDLTKVPKEDLAELFFALGSDGMTTLITTILPQTHSDEDLDGIAFLSSVRNTFYESAPKVS